LAGHLNPSSEQDERYFFCKHTGKAESDLPYSINPIIVSIGHCHSLDGQFSASAASQSQMLFALP
jgi:hypothetical protein